MSGAIWPIILNSQLKAVSFQPVGGFVHKVLLLFLGEALSPLSIFSEANVTGLKSCGPVEHADAAVQIPDGIESGGIYPYLLR